MSIQKFENELLVHAETLLRTAVRVTGSRAEADDLVQETFLRAWKYFGTYTTGTNSRAWLFKIMFNLFKRKQHKVSLYKETSIDDEIGEEYFKDNVIVFDPTRRIESNEVLETVNRLVLEQRVVLFLIAVEEFTYREVANILDVPIGTVMSRLHRARHELRKLLITNSSDAKYIAS